jgi:outer membrane biogenesis lipoprotein LolB
MNQLKIVIAASLLILMQACTETSTKEQPKKQKNWNKFHQKTTRHLK